MHVYTALTSLILTLNSVASGGTTGQGGSCSISNNHLDSASHKFHSDCTDQTYCSGGNNGTCVARTCRRDEFPFGYSDNDLLPPQCPDGTFCPDEGDGCKNLIGEGRACQLNRDEQCASPPNWEELASTQNFNGSVCLDSICMYSNVTLGQSCTTANTVYIDIGADGEEIAYTLTRDNCHSPDFYCEQARLQCERTKPKGFACQSDQECALHNCAEGACADPPETPFRIPPWKYATTIACIVGAMLATCVMLTLIHKRHRVQRFKELREYYYEQSSLRNTIISLHSAAADQYPDEKLRR